MFAGFFGPDFACGFEGDGVFVRTLVANGGRVTVFGFLYAPGFLSFDGYEFDSWWFSFDP